MFLLSFKEINPPSFQVSYLYLHHLQEFYFQQDHFNSHLTTQIFLVYMIGNILLHL
jgi:hypothetical protein